MSQFSVVTGTIEALCGRVANISGEVDEIHGQAAAHASAAAQTPLHGDLDELMGRWGAVLPQFGLAADRLHTAMRGAASAYQASDAAVADAASPR